MHDVFERSARLFWAASLGLIVLFAFLVAFAGLGISEIRWLSIAVLALAIAFSIHAIRVSRELRAAGGGEESVQALNRLRERRGF
jgi:hypothetical protein